MLEPAGHDVPFRIFVTGDVRGYIEPCGCEKGQFGGLPRRGHLLGKARRPQDFAIDLGNFSLGRRPLDRLKLRYMLEGLQLLQYDALVPGEGELALGEDFERAAKALKGPRVLCANLFRVSDGKRVYDPWLVKTLPSGTKVAVIGLTSPFQTIPSLYAVTPLEGALREAIAALRGKADVVIAAGFIDGNPALDLAKAFSELTLILAGRVPQGSPDVLRRGGAPAMFVSELGQYVTWIDLNANLVVASGGQQWLSDDLPDEPAVAALVTRYKQEARVLGQSLSREAVSAFRAEGRVGSHVCGECHQTELAAWSRSGHARAMETLRSKKEESNAECLGCHLQDLPASVSESKPGHGAVGCEACHGAGARHIELARKSKGEIPLRIMEGVAMSACLRCHDRENSREFNLDVYWKRIRHGPDWDGGVK